MKRKILIVIPSIEIGGGAEKNAASLARAFSTEREVRFANFYRIRNEYDLPQFRYLLGEKPGKSTASKVYFFIRRLLFIYRVCRHYKPDVILSFGFHSNLVVSLVSLISIRRRYDVILSIRTNIFRVSRFSRLLFRFLYNRVETTHVITKQMKENVSSIGIRNAVTIYNGHPLVSYIQASESFEFSGVSSCQTVFLTIGRLTHAKGHWNLLKAFSLVTVDHPTAVLVIIGEGELENDLIDLCLRLGLTDKVLMMGNVDNVFPYLKRADCFCFTSFFEGLPNAVIEAAALGVPIVTTDCVSGPREILFPELEVDERVEYPYHREANSLVAPFVDEPFDGDLALTCLHQRYAAEMSHVVNMGVSKRGSKVAEQVANIPAELRRFDEGEVIKHWHDLIEPTKQTKNGR